MDPRADGTRMEPRRERDLVARAVSDGHAFAELYDFYLPRIYAFVVRRVEERTTAEDLTAMTFERALGALRGGGFRNEAFGGWLYRVAANAIVDHARRGRRYVPLGVRASDLDEAGEGRQTLSDPILDAADERALAAFAAALDRDELRRALLAVGEAHRRTIVARYVDGLEGDALAAALGCSKGTAAVRVHRALRALRETLEREATDAA